MIDNASVAISDLEAASKFYRAIHTPLEMGQLITRYATTGFGKIYPEFWLNARPEMKHVSNESGSHICLRCKSKYAVIAFHEMALAEARSDAGRPQTAKALRRCISEGSSLTWTTTGSRPPPSPERTQNECSHFQ